MSTKSLYVQLEIFVTSVQWFCPRLTWGLTVTWLVAWRIERRKRCTDLLNSPWSNYFWPTGHFTKAWQLSATSNKMMYSMKHQIHNIRNYKREDKWVHHWNYYTITNNNLMQMSIAGCLWSGLHWHYRSFINTSVSGSRHSRAYEGEVREVHRTRVR